jgi:glycerophosphoryl diester phosphodiesterase
MPNSKGQRRHQRPAVSEFIPAATTSGRPAVPAAPLIVAHRGNSVRFPENTLAAIHSAFDLGADIVEVDVQSSRDGVPFVFHNETLDETTDGNGIACSRTLAELKQLDAGSWMEARFSGERIPSFEEALEASRQRGRLLIDVNCGGIAREIAASYRRLGVPEDAAIIGAWTDGEIEEFVCEMPRALVLRAGAAAEHCDSHYFDRFKALGVRGFEIGGHCPQPFVEAAHAAGMLVIAYTVNDEATMRRLIRIGVDGFETDDPALGVLVRNTLSL